MICDTCIHKEVCYEKEEDRRALKHCSDYFNFEDELEKIKVEMEEISYADKEFEGERNVDLKDVNSILNEYIAELKGE